MQRTQPSRFLIVALAALMPMSGCTGIREARERLAAAPRLDVAVPEYFWREPGSGKFALTGSAMFAVRSAERRAALLGRLDRLQLERSDVPIYPGKHVGGIEIVEAGAGGRDPAMLTLEPRDAGADVVMLSDGRYTSYATTNGYTFRNLLVGWIPESPSPIPGFDDRTRDAGAEELRAAVDRADRLIILSQDAERADAVLTGTSVREAAVLLPDQSRARLASPAFYLKPPRLVTVRAEGPGGRQSWFHVGDGRKVYFVALPDAAGDGENWLGSEMVYAIDLPDDRLWTFLTERAGAGPGPARGTEK